jgi:YcxB-like protein
MTVQFGYNKRQVLDGLRGHFFSRPEIKTLIIVINAFSITSVVSFCLHKIQAMPFIIFSFLWLLLWLSVRRFLPLSIYKRSATFQDTFILSLDDQGVLLETERGNQVWKWESFSAFKETLYFFHLYFDSRSFFMIPKDSFRDLPQIQDARKIFKDHITNRRS